jgi:Cu-Zn family superoxide dismutase
MIQVNYRWLIPWLLMPLALLSACEREKPQTPATTQEQQAPATAQEQQVPAITEEKQAQTAPGEQEKTAQTMKGTAELEPTEGNKATGTVTFTSVDGGVQIVADLEGLEPGKHGFHIHENGDCSAPDAESAGGHLNPEGSPHGAPDNPAAQRHVGDLGNVEADEEGKAHYERTDQVISMEGENTILGKAVIVHAQPDDLETQPTGGAGPRLACGVIQTRE